MKKRSGACVLLILFTCSAFSQKQKLKFHSINTAGLAIGQSENNAIIQSVNGVALSTWYYGVGIGIDYYKYRTMPLFIDVRRSFGRNSNGFVYGDAGYGFNLKNKPGNEVGYYNSYSFKGGLNTDVGIGYKTDPLKKCSVIFSIGHTYKTMQSRIGIAPLCLECEPYFYDFKFGYGRIIIRTGVEF
jgi:hypothetical protein